MKSDEYKNGFNYAVECALNIINKSMIERYGTHISTYEILLKIKGELLSNSFGAPDPHSFKPKDYENLCVNQIEAYTRWG